MPQGTVLASLLLHRSSIIEAASFTTSTLHADNTQPSLCSSLRGRHTFHANSRKQLANLSALNRRLQLTLSRTEPLVIVIQPVNHSHTSDGSSLSARLLVAALVISQTHECSVQMALWADGVGC